MYEKVYTALTPLSIATPGYLSAFMFSKTWDAVLGIGGGQWFRVFHDGSFAVYGSGSSNWNAGQRIGGLPVLALAGDGIVYGTFEVNGVPNYNEVLNPDFALTNTNGFYIGYSPFFIDDVNGVFVWRDTANTFTVRSLADGSLIRTITHGLNISYSHLSWAGPGQLCAICPSHGSPSPVAKVLFFDYLGDEGVIETGSLEECTLATYDCLCKVFLTYTNADKLIRVYVRSADPANLSNPAFTTSPVGVGASEVKVRLTGNDGEPCVGWMINWELDASEGSGPFGSLSKYASMTDEEGYAATTYFGPRDGETGDTIIKAWVEV